MEWTSDTGRRGHPKSASRYNMTQLFERLSLTRRYLRGDSSKRVAVTPLANARRVRQPAEAQRSALKPEDVRGSNLSPPRRVRTRADDENRAISMPTRHFFFFTFANRLCTPSWRHLRDSFQTAMAGLAGAAPVSRLFCLRVRRRKVWVATERVQHAKPCGDEQLGRTRRASDAR